MTLQELYRRTLERLQVAGDGEPAQPADVQIVAAKYDAVFEMLHGKGLADWDAQQDVPPDAGLALIFIMAAHCADDFNIPEPRKSALKVEGYLDMPTPSLAERMLVKRLASAYISKPAQSEYF